MTPWSSLLKKRDLVETLGQSREDLTNEDLGGVASLKSEERELDSTLNSAAEVSAEKVAVKRAEYELRKQVDAHFGGKPWPDADEGGIEEEIASRRAFQAQMDSMKRQAQFL